MAEIVINTNTTWNEDKFFYNDDILVTDGAILTIDSHNKVNSPDTMIEIWCKRLIIDEGARISADGKGYPGGYGKQDGFGPGGGPYGANYGRGSAGGSYGGKGGKGTEDNYTAPSPRDAYGTQLYANQQGSGGGGAHDYYSTDYKNWGGHGGGAIGIHCSELIVNGVISANGTNGSKANRSGGGGGAGGGIHISAFVVRGTGLIQAKGGDGATASRTDGGGGGGGRISVYCDKLFSPDFDVSGGEHGAILAQDGTIYLPLCLSLSQRYFIVNSSGFDSITFNFYKCKNWSEESTHGGDINWHDLLDMNNIFDDVSHTEREQGSTSYKKVFFANESFVPLSNIKGYISQLTPALNDEIYICASGTNTDTVAEASGYTFVQPSSLSDLDGRV